MRAWAGEPTGRVRRGGEDLNERRYSQLWTGAKPGDASNIKTY